LMKEALSSSDTSVLTRATRRNITEDTIVRYKFERNFLKCVCYLHHVCLCVCVSLLACV
jgi:hypothetical protein